MPGSKRSVSAPAPAVSSTVAPAARQRATISGRGSPKRLPKPAETSARRGPTALTNASLEELRLPWCGTSTTSAASGSASIAASALASVSASSSARPPGPPTRIAQEPSLSPQRPVPSGCSTLNSTPSQVQRSPAAHGAAPASATGPRMRSGGSAAASAGSPPAWSRSSWLTTSVSTRLTPAARSQGTSECLAAAPPPRHPGPVS